MHYTDERGNSLAKNIFIEGLILYCAPAPEEPMMHIETWEIVYEFVGLCLCERPLFVFIPLTHAQTCPHTCVCGVISVDDYGLRGEISASVHRSRRRNGEPTRQANVVSSMNAVAVAIRQAGIYDATP